MKRKKTTQLSLEILEERWVPASASQNGTTLQITNSSLTPATVVITQTAPNSFTVSGSAAGNFSGITLINYSGSNGVDNVTLNLNSLTYGGSAIFNTGGGNDVVTVTNGTMQGQLSVFGGLGNDTVNLASTGPLTVQSPVSITDTSGTNTLGLASGGALVVNNDFSETGFANVTQGANPISVDGSFAINNGITTTANSINLAGTITVGKNFTLNTATSDDQVTLGANSAGGALEVDGRLSLGLGAGNDSVTINGGRGGFVTLNLDAGAGNDSVTLVDAAPATWQVNIQLGDGNDTINIQNGAAGSPSFITGSVNGGNGVNSLATFGSDWTIIPPWNETGF